MNTRKLKTLKEVAEMVETSPGALRVMISRKKIKAVKLGRDWFMTDKQIEKLLNNMGQ